MNHRSMQEVRSLLHAGKTTVRQIVAFYLENIEKHKYLNAFIETFDKHALAQADAIDARLKEGKAGKLAGMVLGIKDVLCLKGQSVTASSKILQGFESQFTGTAIQRLLDEDAIIIGRQGCDEFAMGSSSENSCYGPVFNFANPSRVPGGSSGASAVAVQANLCHASIASDTGGSIRQPAAFCGLYGLKPTYSRVSRYGLVEYGSSFDCIGPLTRSLEDAAELLEIMAGYDENDNTSSRQPVEAYSQLESDSKKLKFGYLSNSFDGNVQPEIRAALQQKIDLLREKGHEVEPFEFPYLNHILPTYYILTTAEASSNLSRYDGVRFGYRSPNATNLESMYKKTRSEAFGKEVQKRIMLGTFVLSASYFDAYFTKAQKVRRLLFDATETLFQKFDFLIQPTTPTTAFRVGEKSTDSLTMFLADIFTVHANLVGNPCISFPCGTDDEGMPIGLQIQAPRFQEKALLQVVKTLE